MAESVRIGILGAGAIGTLLATLLEKAGYEVVCVVKDDQVEALRVSGLTLESKLFGTVTTHPRIEARLSVPVDVLFVTVKSPFLKESLERIPTDMVSGFAVSLLNGVGNVEVMREKLPRAILGTIGSVEVEATGLGRATHIGTLVPHIEMAGDKKTLEPIAHALETAGFSVTLREREADVLWGKLARLNALASVTALSGKTVGEVRSDATLRARFEALIKEGAAVAAQEGASIDIAATIAFIDTQPAEMTTSLERDIQNGAPSELETITGGVLQKARALGVNTPVLEETYRLLKEKVS